MFRAVGAGVELRLWMPDRAAVAWLDEAGGGAADDDWDAAGAEPDGRAGGGVLGGGVLDGDVLDGDLLGEAGPFVAPVWWVAERPCPGGQRCGCGPVSLSVALDVVGPADRDRVLTAHLAVLADLLAHEHAARVAAGDDAAEPGDDGPACVACLLEPEAHAATLGDEVADRCLELAEAGVAFGLRAGR